MGEVRFREKFGLGKVQFGRCLVTEKFGSHFSNNRVLLKLLGAVSVDRCIMGRLSKSRKSTRYSIFEALKKRCGIGRCCMVENFYGRSQIQDAELIFLFL